MSDSDEARVEALSQAGDSDSSLSESSEMETSGDDLNLDDAIRQIPDPQVVRKLRALNKASTGLSDNNLTQEGAYLLEECKKTANDYVRYPEHTERNKQELKNLWKKGTRFVTKMHTQHPQQWAKVMAAEDSEFIKALDSPTLSDLLKRLGQWAKKKFGNLVEKIKAKGKAIYHMFLVGLAIAAVVSLVGLIAGIVLTTVGGLGAIAYVIPLVILLATVLVLGIAVGTAAFMVWLQRKPATETEQPTTQDAV
jgi:hypothetical protein